MSKTHETPAKYGDSAAVTRHHDDIILSVGTGGQELDSDGCHEEGGRGYYVFLSAPQAERVGRRLLKAAESARKAVQ